MEPREIVRRTLEFDAPPRVPRQLWLLPWASIHYPNELAAIRARFPDDIIHAPSFCRTPVPHSGDPHVIGAYTDEWGCTFENIQAGVIGEIKAPLVADWSDLDKVRPPIEALTVDVERVNAFCRGSDRFVLSGCCARPFERLQFLRGSENVYLDLGSRPPELFELLGRIHDFYRKEMELWAQTDVDALNFMDDWGSQRALLISPKQWRAIFKPMYREYIEIAHAAGKKAFMHSDGYIADIIPDLIEIGLDAINSQVFCMDLEQLGAQFAGKITFWGEVDRQHLLSEATVPEVVAAVRRAKAALWRDGGAIAQCEFGPGGKPENVWAVYETWEE
ncbi:MAG: Uroporphyrinogen decarboxylase (URO-D) [Chloroflexi bacterium ADurb.Bin325]|nr:MAG: Uroporphyrinogen decarboxylase (URO-D) [Chloroflexi bacterium ADurb.Bin325]